MKLAKLVSLCDIPFPRSIATIVATPAILALAHFLPFWHEIEAFIVCLCFIGVIVVVDKKVVDSRLPDGS